MLFRPFWPFFIVRFLQGIVFACLDTGMIAYVIRIMLMGYRTGIINYFMLAPPLASAVATSSGVFVLNEYGFNIGAVAGICRDRGFHRDLEWGILVILGVALICLN
jgi:hypothetical protein